MYWHRYKIFIFLVFLVGALGWAQDELDGREKIEKKEEVDKKTISTESDEEPKEKEPVLSVSDKKYLEAFSASAKTWLNKKIEHKNRPDIDLLLEPKKDEKCSEYIARLASEIYQKKKFNSLFKPMVKAFCEAKDDFHEYSENALCLENSFKGADNPSVVLDQIAFHSYKECKLYPHQERVEKEEGKPELLGDFNISSRTFIDGHKFGGISGTYFDSSKDSFVLVSDNLHDDGGAKVYDISFNSFFDRKDFGFSIGGPEVYKGFGGLEAISVHGDLKIVGVENFSLDPKKTKKLQEKMACKTGLCILQDGKLLPLRLPVTHQDGKIERYEERERPVFEERTKYKTVEPGFFDYVSEAFGFGEAKPKKVADGKERVDTGRTETYRDYENYEQGPQSNNLGFEGVSFSPSGKYLFAITERPLGMDNHAKIGGKNILRLLRFKVLEEGRLDLEGVYLYPLENIRHNYSYEASDLLALSDEEFLVIERRWDKDARHPKMWGTVQKANLSSAKNILVDIKKIEERGNHAEADEDEDKALDLTRYKTSETIKKNLYIDLNKLKNYFAPGWRSIDNPEALAFGPQLADGRRSLLIVSDNNFNSRTQRTQFFFFAVPQ